MIAASDNRAIGIRDRIRSALDKASVEKGGGAVPSTWDGTRRRQPAREGTELLAKLRHRAAILGFFDPDDLASRVSPGENFEDALELLSCECRSEIRGDKSLWMLSADARRKALAELVASHQIQKSARRAVPRSDDRFGRYMRATILGKGLNPERFRSEVLNDLLTVREFLFDVVPAAPRPSEIQAILLRRFYEKSLHTVLPTRLIGRRDELTRLRRFIEADAAPPPLKGCIVTGVGGSGKSALMAGLIRSLRRKDDAPSIVILDFDHPLLAAGEPATLMQELTRQLAVARPDLFDELCKFRASIAPVIGSDDESPKERFESSASHSVRVMESFGKFASTHRIDSMKIVLILDTFEEILVRGESALEPVLSWIGELSEAGRLRNLRPILCGRASPNDVSAFWQSRIAEHIELKDLTYHDAVLFLRTRELHYEEAGKPPRALRLRLDEARTLARCFGGNPLALRIVADDRLRHRDEPLERFAVPEGNDSPGLRGEAAQQYLFDRILNRIRPIRIRKLAYPGLILRRVTPDLIKKVLAPECDLGELSDADANELFEALSNEVWLVKRTGRGEVIHNRDLRRLMLPGIVEETPMREAKLPGVPTDAPGRARRINQAAAEYYEERRDPHLPPAAQATEGLYHRLMAKEAVEFDASGAQNLAASLGGDLSDLPDEARSRLRFQLGRVVTSWSASMLSSREYGVFIEREGRRLIDKGRPDEALSLVENDRHHRAKPPSWWIEALFARGRFGEVVEHGENSLSALIDSFPVTGASNRERGLTNSDAWRVAVAPVLAGDLQAGRTVVATALSRAELGSPSEKWEKFDSARLTALAVLSAAGRLTGEPATPSPQELFDRIAPFATGFDARRRKGDIKPAQSFVWTRLAALAARELHGHRLFVSIERLPMFDPLFVDSLLEWVVAVKPRSWPRNQSIVRRLSSHAKLLHSGKSTLAKLDLSLREIGVDIELRFETPPAALMSSLLRATTPELRAPAREGLAEAFGDQEGQLRLAAALESVAPIFVSELRPEIFAGLAQRDPRRWISVMLLFADRANVLGKLLNAARDVALAGNDLNALVNSFTRFDRALSPN